MFEIGPFQLDESARVLRLAEREIALQPRVFDLLTYLVRNRARVVSKDELLDKLWPDVTVTDNSLQRAVSNLRAALRHGGMENAIRNFPKSGYRFCLEPTSDAAGNVQAVRSSPDQREEARRAIREQRWSEAIELFRQIDTASSLTADDLDGWALALQCLGQPSDAVPVLVRSIAMYSEEEDYERAAEGVATLSTIHLERGEVALAKGWLSRARELANHVPESPAYGRVLWLASRIAAFDGDPQEALKLADAAYQSGRACGDYKIEAMGLMYRGFYRLSLGETREGLADQDHAAALALSKKPDPITGGILYCNILWACRTFGDWARANQWTVGYQRFCTESRMGFSGSCQLHRAEVLGVHGSLIEARAHIEDALSRLSVDAPWALGDAYRVLGDIHAAIGDLDAASIAYDQSYALGWNPEPGRAMLLLERGEAEAAYSSLERSLIGQSWWTLQRQGMLLAYLALVAAHAGKHEKAKSLIDELAGQEKRWPMPSIRALTNEASALLARERGEVNEALRHLHLARQLWTSIDCRLNATRLRMQIAALQLKLGDKMGAGAELRIAFEVVNALKSEKMLRQCEILQQSLG